MLNKQVLAKIIQDSLPHRVIITITKCHYKKEDDEDGFIGDHITCSFSETSIYGGKRKHNCLIRTDVYNMELSKSKAVIFKD